MHVGARVAGDGPDFFRHLVVRDVEFCRGCCLGGEVVGCDGGGYGDFFGVAQRS